ncbi:MAG: hypothetical protein GC189_12115 [Alphaproteobacteria bacterium]|nr:hypothetical protein [Alphaproteobacteria bacterium]
MRLKVWTLALVAAAALSACATATPYQPRASAQAYGFSDQQIEANRVRVSFRGNTLTERETVENYLLYRAAELTTERGYDYFIVTTRETEPRTRLQSVGPTRYPFDYYYFHPRWGWRSWYDPFWDQVDYREVTQYEASAEITMYRGEKPADNPSAFGARDVQANLGPAIVRPAPQ